MSVPSTARLQPSVQPHLEHHSCSSQDKYGGNTVSAAQHRIPADPHNKRSVSSPQSISTTPKMQSSTHSPSNGQRASAVMSPSYNCDDALTHQARVVEGVINRYNSQLTVAISNNITYFSSKFIELGFISMYASQNILSKRIGSGDKSAELLSAIMGNFCASNYKKYWFDKFVSVFSSEASYNDLATSMTTDLATSMADEFKSCVPGTCLSPATSCRHSSIDHLAPPVRCFINHVAAIYTSKIVERTTSVVKWPPTPSKVYINLVCIDRHSVSGKSREYDEVTEAMVRDGNVDVVLNGPKGPIDFNEIAKNISIPNSRERGLPHRKDYERRLILVEGAPGVGKSTFAWEFCRRWERGEIAQQYELVLLLRLREDRISKAKCLQDLIYHPLKDVPQAVCHELVRSHNFHALIILEGFDELPDICRQDESVFMDLIAGRLLPLATILVTSRPWATEGIRLKHEDRIYQHIEILGFTSCQITEYIERTLPQEKVSDLKVYLETHPQIKAGMYIPLNSAIVVTVYEESQASGCTMPTTLTELYTSLTQTLLVRYLRGHPEYKTYGKSLATFKDLPSPVFARFKQLCKLAYNGTVATRDQVQLIFRDLPTDFDNLGFMDSVTELYVTRGAVSSHNFLHLTFQEFFLLQYTSLACHQKSKWSTSRDTRRVG